jgi:hypothetical protein
MTMHISATAHPETPHETVSAQPGTQKLQTQPPLCPREAYTMTSSRKTTPI